jgi:hypothetical protein
MNKFKSITQSLRWFMAFLLVAFVAGCGGGSGGGVAPSHTKAITAYSLAAYSAAVVTINEPLKTIQVVVPNGTPVTALKALVATFTSTGAGLPTVGGVNQVSGTTANDFTLPKPYIVTAADGTTATYTVTVSVALNSAKAITSYSLGGTAGAITGSASPFAIAVTVPNGTSLSGLIATFATTGNSVTVGTPAVTQVSGNTVNTFPASPGSLAYTVHAADGTTAIYNVTVTVAASAAKAITSFSFVGYTPTVAITGTSSPFAIAVTVPNGTIVTNLVATFVTTGSSVTVGTAPAVTQTTGSTANNFTSPVAYTVHAADTTTAIYNVTVTVAAAAGPVVCTTGTLNCVDLGTAANYVILAKASVTTIPASVVTGDIGLSPAAGSFLIGFPTSPQLDATGCFSTSTQVIGKLYASDYSTNGCTTPALLTAAVGTGNPTGMEAAYTNANLLQPSGGGDTAVGGVACPGLAGPGGTAGAFGGMTLTPGVYTCTVTIDIATGRNLTLNGAGIYVFRTTAGMTQASGTQVILTGGALPQNVFWVPAQTVSIIGTAGVATKMAGVILAKTNIAVGTNATVNGRLLSQTAVTLDAATITQP